MKEIKYYARGGQGAVTASKVMVQSAALDGKFAQSIPSYGQERQGAPIFCFARIADGYIPTKSYVEEPDIAIVFDSGLKHSGVDVLANVKEGAVVVVNSQYDMKEYFENDSVGTIVSVDANEITKRIIGNVPPNMAMLGALAKVEDTVSIDSVCEAIKIKLKGKAGELNAEAAREAYEKAIIKVRKI